MHDPRAKLQKIVERSAFLYERIGSGFFKSVPANAEKAAVQERLQRWSQQVPRGNRAYFDKRLAWDGMDREDAKRLLGRVELSNTEHLPSWADYLEGVLSRAAKLHHTSLAVIERSTPFFSPASRLPFEHVLSCFVEEATERLFAATGTDLSCISSAAVIELQSYLLSTLCWISERTLLAEFIVWRAIPGDEPATDAERRLYSSFVQSLWGGGLLCFFEEYPVLARFLARAAEQWVSSTAAFLRHVQEDLVELSTAFHYGKPLGYIQKIKPGLSDRHNGGGTVIEVRFEGGPNCLYKQRSCKTDLEFNNFLSWLNENSQPSLSFRTYGVLERPTHGWTEKVSVRPCVDPQQVRRYFERAGMLIAVLYALGASDCHVENILADGEYPILIDAETLMQPRAAIDAFNSWEALSAASEATFYDSVLGLGILPRWIPRPGGEKMDVSGLGSQPGRRGASQHKVWEHINTDQMSLSYERTEHVIGRGSLSLNGHAVNASEYVDEIITGFEEMYRKLIGHRDWLCSEEGLLGRMKGCAPRIIFRDTHIYAGLLDKCLMPQYLKDGMDASICIDVLAHVFANWEEKPKAWPIIAAEHAALLELDIPRFDSPAETHVLEIGNGSYIPGYLLESSRSRLKRRISKLSEDDLDLQERYIRCSFGNSEEAYCSVEDSSPLQPTETVDADAFLGQAMAIAEAIRSHAIYASDGTAGWITQVYNVDSQFWQLQPLGLSFYDGICGTAVFLAALESVDGLARHRALLDAALKAVKQFSSRSMECQLEREGIGAAVGTGSLAYALGRIAMFMQDEALLETSLRLMRLTTKAHVAADHRLDVIGGTAGCLLVLYALYRIKPLSWILDLSVDCGEHLLESRSMTSSRLRAWQTIQGKYLTGFSHGTAGIAFALSRLYELTSDERYRQAAQEAVEYENSLFSEEGKNWPYLLSKRKDGVLEFWNSWCHGAPGIGLARLGSYGCLETQTCNRDLAFALSKASDVQLMNLDTPCCGNLGRIELLLEASDRLAKPEHLNRARQIGAAVVDRARKVGQYAVGVRNGIFLPSFHQGMAGVGYQLLRLARPGQLPSVLCLE